MKTQDLEWDLGSMLSLQLEELQMCVIGIWICKDTELRPETQAVGSAALPAKVGSGGWCMGPEGQLWAP
eukprot:508839-Rhodomonas_salina.1